MDQRAYFVFGQLRDGVKECYSYALSESDHQSSPPLFIRQQRG
ncbi:hypothetical protein DFP76_11511 [Marinomonas aquiplantarum]|uniref:Uncharacterized protein n=1 Tax=Marinomonas aquiplantarum TaxID=491951 RepID=A0A366CSZ3_9GAMM|nr:hypothetical protein DFP76_11511 [Marinomonas aquiplantarum]